MNQRSVAANAASVEVGNAAGSKEGVGVDVGVGDTGPTGSAGPAGPDSPGTVEAIEF